MLISHNITKIVGEYVEVDEGEKLPHHEQKKWEQEQMSSAVYKFGSRSDSKKVIILFF